MYSIIVLYSVQSALNGKLYLLDTNNTIKIAIPYNSDFKFSDSKLKSLWSELPFKEITVWSIQSSINLYLFRYLSLKWSQHFTHCSVEYSLKSCSAIAHYIGRESDRYSATFPSMYPQTGTMGLRSGWYGDLWLCDQHLWRTL